MFIPNISPPFQDATSVIPSQCARVPLVKVFPLGQKKVLFKSITQRRLQGGMLTHLRVAGVSGALNGIHLPGRRPSPCYKGTHLFIKLKPPGPGLAPPSQLLLAVNSVLRNKRTCSAMAPEVGKSSGLVYRRTSPCSLQIGFARSPRFLCLL